MSTERPIQRRATLLEKFNSYNPLDFLKKIGWIFLLLTPIPILFTSFFRSTENGKSVNKNFFLPPPLQARQDGWKLVMGQNLARLSILVGLTVLLPLAFYMLTSGALLVRSPTDLFNAVEVFTTYFASILSLYLLRTVASAIGLAFTKNLVNETQQKMQVKGGKKPALSTWPSVFYNALRIGFWGDVNNEMKEVFQEVKDHITNPNIDRSGVKRNIAGYTVATLISFGLLVAGIVAFDIRLFDFIPDAMELINSGWGSFSWQTQLVVAVLPGLAALPIAFLPTNKRSQMIIAGLAVFSLIEIATLASMFLLPPSSDSLLSVGLPIEAQAGILGCLGVFSLGLILYLVITSMQSGKDKTAEVTVPPAVRQEGGSGPNLNSTDHPPTFAVTAELKSSANEDKRVLDKGNQNKSLAEIELDMSSMLKTIHDAIAGRYVPNLPLNLFLGKQVQSFNDKVNTLSQADAENFKNNFSKKLREHLSSLDPEDLFSSTETLIKTSENLDFEDSSSISVNTLIKEHYTACAKKTGFFNCAIKELSPSVENEALKLKTEDQMRTETINMERLHRELFFKMQKIEKEQNSRELTKSDFSAKMAFKLRRIYGADQPSHQWLEEDSPEYQGQFTKFETALCAGIEHLFPLSNELQPGRKGEEKGNGNPAAFSLPPKKGKAPVACSPFQAVSVSTSSTSENIASDYSRTPDAAAGKLPAALLESSSRLSFSGDTNKRKELAVEKEKGNLDPAPTDVATRVDQGRLLGELS